MAGTDMMATPTATFRNDTGGAAYGSGGAPTSADKEVKNFLVSDEPLGGVNVAVGDGMFSELILA